jgi:glucokinase
MRSEDRRVLAGDIGGTHARLALFQVGEGRPRLLSKTMFKSQEYDGLEPIVTEFLRGLDQDVELACFGLACPVEEGVCHFTNLGWEVRTEGFGDAVGIARVRLVNDFEAVGYGVSVLDQEQVVTLQEGTPGEGGPVALIGAGTGLGQGFMLWEEGRYTVHASEGGHADFAPSDPILWKLHQVLQERHGHVSWERVVSGQGLVDAYAFLRDAGRAPERDEVLRDLQEEEADPAEVISRHARTGEDTLCSQAMAIFLRAFGAQAGNFALTIRATGGVYLAGGIAPKILPMLREGPFLEAFGRKGRLSGLMEKVPVRVIVDDTVGLQGAAVAAARW